MTTQAAPIRESLPLLDRDLSWLEFNSRVLHEAEDDRTPLLERVKFLAIFSSNLDEFFMKRGEVLAPKRMDHVLSAALDQAPSRRQRAIREKIANMMAAQAKVFAQTIRPELSRNGVCLLDWDELTDDERRQLNEPFRKTIYPAQTLTSQRRARNRSAGIRCRLGFATT